MRVVVACVAACLLSGCLASAAVDVVTLPVKVVGKGVDWATTSQEEADRNYGRKMRKQEAREGRELKKRQKEEEKRRKEEAKRAREARDRDDG